MRKRKTFVAFMTIVALLGTAALAAAASGIKIKSDRGGASLSCPGGMSRLGHVVGENMSVFFDDPAVFVEDIYTVAVDFFEVEAVAIGSHAGTHLDIPAHFIEDGRTLEDLAADEFVWPVYKIDVRGIEVNEGDAIEKDFIRGYEREHGKIKPGSLVVLQTGAEEFFGLDGPGDERVVVTDDDGNVLAQNVDDMFTFDNAGFSGAAIDWMFDKRQIAGVGSDAYGPDPWWDADEADDFFDATFTTLANDGVALVAIANLDSVGINTDIIMAPTIALEDGSGFSTDPIACHGKPKN